MSDQDRWREYDEWLAATERGPAGPQAREQAEQVTEDNPSPERAREAMTVPASRLRIEVARNPLPSGMG